jgi:hypothetical protein
VITIFKTHRAGKRSKAQGMVEFALALPVFLLLMFGIIEFARVMVTYSSVYTASREAVRYGVAFGMSDHGVPYWKDCQGIRAAGVRLGTIGGVQVGDIDIRYDTGLVEMPAAFNTLPTCEDIVSSGYQVKLGHRMLVKVTTRFTPIVPLVNISEFDVASTTARTFLVAVDVMGTPLPTSTRIHTYTPTLDKTATALVLSQTAAQATKNFENTATEAWHETLTAIALIPTDPIPTEVQPTTLVPTDILPPVATNTPVTPSPPSNTPTPVTPSPTLAPTINCEAEGNQISFIEEQKLADSYIIVVKNGYDEDRSVQVRGIGIWWPVGAPNLVEFTFGVATTENGEFEPPSYEYFWDGDGPIFSKQGDPGDRIQLLLTFLSDYDFESINTPAINVMLENSCSYVFGSWPTPTPIPDPETVEPPSEINQAWKR